MFKDDSILSEGYIPAAANQDLPEGKALMLESDKLDKTKSTQDPET